MPCLGPLHGKADCIPLPPSQTGLTCGACTLNAIGQDGEPLSKCDRSSSNSPRPIRYEQARQEAHPPFVALASRRCLVPFCLPIFVRARMRPCICIQSTSPCSESKRSLGKATSSKTLAIASQANATTAGFMGLQCIVHPHVQYQESLPHLSILQVQFQARVCLCMQVRVNPESNEPMETAASQPGRTESSEPFRRHTHTHTHTHTKYLFSRVMI
jgi:hypothetical protein